MILNPSSFPFVSLPCASSILLTLVDVKVYDPFGVMETLDQLEVLSKQFTMYAKKGRLLVVLPDANGGHTLARVNFAHYKVQMLVQYRCLTFLPRYYPSLFNAPKSLPTCHLHQPFIQSPMTSTNEMLSRYAPSVIKSINSMGLGLLSLVQTLEQNLSSQRLADVATLLDTPRRT